MTNIIVNGWSQCRYVLPNKILVVNHITEAFNGFLNKVKFNNESAYMVIFKVKLNNGVYRNISTLQVLNSNSVHEILENFIEYWSLKDDDYLTYSIDEIIFTYKIINGGNLNTTKNIKNNSFLKNKSIENKHLWLV